MIKSLSIIFPMYNETKRLFRTFDDIEKFQRRNLVRNLEYLFVDDGSSDDSIKKVLNLHTQNTLVRSSSQVRTPGFHPGNRGSIPLRTAKINFMANHKSTKKKNAF